MELYQRIIIIAIVALTTMLTRFLPFIIFRSDRPTPVFLKYLSRALPPAVFGMLVVYCLKGISFTAPAFALPEIIGVISVVVLHLCFRKMLVSIGVGTVIYMILLNVVFV